MEKTSERRESEDRKSPFLSKFTCLRGKDLLQRRGLGSVTSQKALRSLGKSNVKFIPQFSQEDAQLRGCSTLVVMQFGVQILVCVVKTAA